MSLTGKAEANQTTGKAMVAIEECYWLKEAQRRTKRWMFSLRTKR